MQNDSNARQNQDLRQSRRSTVKRNPERGSVDRATVEAILDAGLVCHVAAATEDGPVVLPMVYGRVGRVLYIHGSPAAGTLRALRKGAPACVAVTHVDGLVLARSAFHHTMNYRCAVLHGTFREITDPSEVDAALTAITDAVLPDRSRHCRPPNDKELRATLVLGLDIEEGSAKVRTGPPNDEPEDLDLPYWAGVIPMGLVATGSPEPDEHVPTGVTLAVADPPAS